MVTIFYSLRPHLRRYLTPGQTLPAGATRATNRLNFVNDGVTIHTGNDIEDQSVNNYNYDETGNLTKDVKEGITNIEWTVYGKIKKITKSTGTIEYTYDAAGNRISKTANNKTTVYVRDASGNLMSVYEQTGSGTTAQIETDLYGSSRLGLQTAHTVPDVNITLANGDIATLTTFTRGEKIFELSNHLGNVLVTVNDRKVQHTTDNSTVDYWEADVVSANDYYPFGMTMPGREYNAGSYRYGFNGQEDDEIAAGLTTALYWEYDSRIGRRWNPDPVINISESRYACFGNNPIYYSDPLGDFKSKFSAKMYALFHGGTVSRQSENSGAHSGEWRVAKKGTYNGPDGGVAVNVKYSWGNNKVINTARAVKSWWNSVELVDQTSVEGDVGIQGGVDVRINSIFKAKIEGGVNVNTIFRIKTDALHMDRSTVNYGLFEQSDDNFHIQRNYVNIGIEAGIPKNDNTTPTIGWDYYETQKYYNGYYGPQTVEATSSSGFNGNLKLKQFNSGSTEPVIINKFSGKAGVNTEKKFYGLDISVSVKMLLGVKLQIKMGFQKK